MVGLAIIGALVYILVSLLGARTSYTTPSPNNPATTNTNTTKPGSVEVLVDDSFTIRNLTQIPTDIGQQTELILQNPAGLKLSKTDALALLIPDLPGSIERYLTQIRLFKFPSSSSPIVQLRFSNQTALRGELFAYEPELSASLDKLYDIRAAGRFVDKQLLGIDARVFLADSQVEYVTYGFVDGNTLIITDSPDTFVAFVSQRLLQ